MREREEIEPFDPFVCRVLEMLRYLDPDDLSRDRDRDIGVDKRQVLFFTKGGSGDQSPTGDVVGTRRIVLRR